MNPTKRKIDPYPLSDWSAGTPLSDYVNSLDIFKDKAFWIWNKEEHNEQFIKTSGKCCFNHIIGKPIKNGKEYDIFPFQKQIIDVIENNPNIWCLKSRGIGITTLLIRWLAYKILSSSELDHKSIFIISGTREQFANHIKKQLQDLFTNKFPLLRLESKYTELWLKNTWIKVFPTKNIEMVRGYTDVAIIWVDESDHMDPSVQDELFYSIGPYQEKSHAKIILSSTANRPDGLMARIEQDASDKWKKLKLDYTYGLGTIYDPIEIEKMKQDVEFPREMECKYLGKIGNLLTPSQVDHCIQLGEKYKDIPISNYNSHHIGCDFGFSSSKTAIVMTEMIKVLDDQNREKKYAIVRFAEEYDKANPQEIVNICHKLYTKYWNSRVWVDGSNRAAVNLMKIAWDESLNYEPSDINPNVDKILPVSFTKEHRTMLGHLQVMAAEGHLAVPKQFEKLIIGLRTAYAEELNLKKDQTSYDDSIDALRLSLKGYKIN